MESMFIVFWIFLLVTCVQKADSAIDDFMSEAEEDNKTSSADNDLFYYQVNGKKEEFVKFQYDMLLPKRQYDTFMRNGRSFRRHRSRRNAIKDKNKMWPNGRIPYTIDDSFNDTQKDIIEKAIVLWNRWTCLTIVQAGNEYTKLKFKKKSKGCGESFVGMSQGEQPIHLSNKCSANVAVVVHEIGHAIGLYHEHMRHDRDEYVVVNKNNIEETEWYNFKVLKQNEYQNLSKPYDYLSIMHYGKLFFSSNKSAELVTLSPKNESYLDIIGEVQTISFYDAKIVCQLYNCAAKCKTPCSEPAFSGDNCKCMCKGPSYDKPIIECPIEGQRQCFMPFVNYSKYMVLDKISYEKLPKNSGPFDHGTTIEIEWINKESCGWEFVTLKCLNGNWTNDQNGNSTKGLPECQKRRAITLGNNANVITVNTCLFPHTK